MVYVDPLMRCFPNPNWRWTKSCHLFADTVEELHVFARRIGLKRGWFQDNPALQHYDLNQSRRAAAIRLGAKEMDFKQAVCKWKELRIRRIEAVRLRIEQIQKS